VAIVIRLKRIYQPPAKEDGFRILVERLWPRGVSKERARVDLWLKDVAPSPELRTWYGHDPSKWGEFQERYRAELQRNPELERMRQLIEEKKEVTFVYAARDETRNSALVLKLYLEKP
jgi:uncharacterized protein YeaO (DUF488 family)